MKKFTFAFFALLLTLNMYSAEEARLLRFPAIHADKLAFSYGGDLYLVNSDGGMARKLTSHIGYEMFARFSPDGNTLAFTGQYDGNTEVFSIPSQGGVPKRLTYTSTLSRDDIGDRMGPNNIAMTWAPDGSGVVYRSRHYTGGSFTGMLYKVSPEGDMPEQLPFSEASWCSYSPDMNKLAYNRVFREFRTWKYYQGGMADDIWIFDFNTKETINITDNVHQDIFPMWMGEEVYYISDRDRVMNLFVYNTTTKETQKVTNFTDYDIKFPSAGKDYIVFEKGGYIYKFDIKTKEAKKLEIMVADDAVYARSEMKDFSEEIIDGDLSPNGERAVFSARGEVFTVPAENGITQNLTNSCGANDHSAKWSPDGKYIAYISDMNGEFEIYMQKSDGGEKPVQLTSNNKTYIFQIQWSPDSKKIAWYDQNFNLNYVDINTKQVTSVFKSDINRVSDFSWSPDSKWISYVRPQKAMDIIYLYKLADKSHHQVTDMWFDSSSPVFSQDGKYLMFVSDRDFNPDYSRTEWNHIYQNMARIYMITLAKKTASPFAPENDVVSVETASDNSDKSNNKKDKKEEASSNDIVIDTDGLNQRIIGLPIEAANYFNLAEASGKIYYSRWIPGKGTSMNMFDLEAKEEKELGDGISFTISSNGKKMLVSQRNSYAIISTPASKVSMDKKLDLSGMTKRINYSKEWEQIYNEAWRRMRDFFYAKNMHGVDWNAMKDKYAVLVPHIKHRSDLAYVIGELIAELNVGHAYSGNGEHPEPERIKMGLLGATMSKHVSGYFQIDKIFESANWNNAQRSPLNELGVDVNEGNFIIAVNGVSTKDMKNIYQSLVGKANQVVELTVNNSAQESGSRKILVKPIDDESELFYYDWVRTNINKVNEASNGKIGYIHIPDMGVNGLNRWAKLYYPQLQKEALILDDRYNGGGNVSPMIIERLKRTMTYATMHTNQQSGAVNPVGTFLGPKVALVNGYSASDGDLFPYRFKHNKLGKVIGTRTWGGVVGYSGWIPFVDGGYIVTPSYAPYAADGSDFIIEGTGVEPDIFLRNDPYKEFIGVDDQLNKAVEVLLEELEKPQEKVPAIPAFPDKSN